MNRPNFLVMGTEFAAKLAEATDDSVHLRPAQAQTLVDYVASLEAKAAEYLATIDNLAQRVNELEEQIEDATGIDAWNRPYVGKFAPACQGNPASEPTPEGAQ